MSKQTLSANEARAALLRGVDAVANPVKVTLGPRGRNVMLDRPGQPLATRDGVTVAKEVSWLPDPFENMGAAYAREVADAAVTEAGDGTTTASVLLQAIVTGGMKLVDAGCEPLLLADGINAAAAACVASIQQVAIPATPELVEQVAIISTHGDVELGKLIAETTLKVGENGVVELAESRNHETTVEMLEGYYFERGTSEPIFLNDATGKRCVLQDPLILISERVIVGGSPGVHGDHIFNILQEAVKARRPLLVIAEDLQGDALQMFALQVAKGTLPGGAFVKLPGFGESRTAAINDLKIAVGAERIHSITSTRVDDQLSSFKLEDLGSCKQAIVSTTRTVLVEGAGKALRVQDRIGQLIHQSQEATNPFEKQMLDTRIARLTGGVAVLRVGAHSEPAMIEKKARAEDAIHACRAAVKEGVVVGGGTALLRAAKANGYLGLAPFESGGVAVKWDRADLRTGVGAPYLVDDVRKGGEVLLKAMREPALQISRNAGHTNAEEIVKNSEGALGGWGYDAAMGRHADLFGAGVVDPAKVVMVALSKAASIGALLLTTEVLISDIPEKREVPINPAMFRQG
jgi:chaperonin GroEL